MCQILYRLYQKVDKTIFASDPDAFEMRSLDVLREIETLEVIPQRSGFVHRFDDATISAVREANT